MRVQKTITFKKRKCYQLGDFESRLGNIWKKLLKMEFISWTSMLFETAFIQFRCPVKFTTVFYKLYNEFHHDSHANRELIVESSQWCYNLRTVKKYKDKLESGKKYIFSHVFHAQARCIRVNLIWMHSNSTLRVVCFYSTPWNQRGVGVKKKFFWNIGNLDSAQFRWKKDIYRKQIHVIRILQQICHP